MVSFVDDILLGGDTNFTENVNKLRQTFHIGAKLTQTFDYIGIRLEENNNFSITSHQTEYIDCINEINLGATFRQGKKKLTLEKMTLLRKALGQINWVAGMTRPEISYHIGKTSPRVKNETSAHVHTINKAIKYIKNLPFYINVLVLDLSSSGIKLYSDASFNNLPDVKSQGDM